MILFASRRPLRDPNVIRGIKRNVAAQMGYCEAPRLGVNKSTEQPLPYEMKSNSQTISKIRRFFEEMPDDNFCCAYLFGSYARNEMHPDSDIDIAVLFRVTPPSTLSGSGVALAGKLEDVMGKRVDLVVLNRSTPDLIHRILRDDILLFDRDPAQRVRFEVKARNAYFDLKPYLDTYRRTAREHQARDSG